MRVTKRTNIALRVMMFCAANPGRLATKAEISQGCQTSENHLAQVINQLAQIGLLHTQRGRNGGLSLARPPHDVTIGEVFRALEGPLPLAECFSDTDDSCPLISACRLRLALQDAAEVFFAHLDGITLDALVCDNPALMHLLTPPACAAQTRSTMPSPA